MILQALLGSLSLFLFGIDVGNGGDVLRCADNPRLSGLYVLDYLIHPDDGGVGGPLVPVHSWAESRARLTDILARLPALGRSFAEYSELILNEDARRDRLWIASTTPLSDIPTEALRNLPPAGCYEERDGRIRFLQAVVREAPPTAVRYYYDRALFRELESAAAEDPERALQYSMLMVHEWLWDFFAREHSEEVRLVNRFLHSEAADQYGPAELWRALRNLGLGEQFLGPEPGSPAPSGQDTLVAGSGFVCALVAGRVHCWGTHAPPGGSDGTGALVGVTHLVAGLSWLCHLQAGRLGCTHTRTSEATPAWLRDSPLLRRPLRAIFGGGSTLCGQLTDRLSCHLNGASRTSDYPLLPGLVAASAHGARVCMASADRLSCPGQLERALRGLRALTSHGDLVCTSDELSGPRCDSLYGTSDYRSWLDEHGAGATRLALSSTGPCVVAGGELRCFDQDILFGQPVAVSAPTALVTTSDVACLLEDGHVRCFGSNQNGILEVPEALWPAVR